MAAIPALRTSTVLSPTIRVRSRERAEPRVSVLGAALTFAGLTYAFFSFGNLAGSVLTEQARRESLSAIARANAARSAEGLLEKRLDELKSLNSIDRWAAQNGYVASDRVLQTSLSQTSGH